jgi:two-component system response regulator YesN
MSEFFNSFFNIVVPILAGLVYFALARYVKQIGPLRTLVTGQLTYKGAFWGFLLFGVYLASRPLQIFLGPHPLPLIVNNIREFLAIGIFSPAVTVAMMSLVLSPAKVPKILVRLIFGIGIFLAVCFVIINSRAIGGSHFLFSVGNLNAYDGVWFDGREGAPMHYMALLFVIRLIDPVLMVFGAGTLVLWHGFNYPVEKRMLYDNMPRKLYYMGFACYSFSLSMLSVGFLYLFAHIPNQWWIYYVGALVAGILETISLSLPLRRAVQISEHH